MKKILGILLAVAMLLTLAVPAMAETAGADLTGKKVGFSALMMSSEFFTDMSNQMEAYFTERGMEYSVADAAGNAQTQIQTIENFVSMGMDYIICFVVDRVSISDALIRGKEHTMKIVVPGLQHLEEGQRFFVDLRTVTESLYWFDVSYAQLRNDFGLFTEGVTLYSNVSGGYGVLCAAATTTVEVHF